MRIASTYRRPIRGSWHIGRLLLLLSFSLGAPNLVWAMPKPAFGAEPAATTTVLVYNHARVSPAILAAAEREAGRILDAAGVRIIWVECPMGSTTARQSWFEGGGFRFCDHAHSGQRLLRLCSPSRCGTAARRVRRAHYSGLRHSHELGHLLLGPNSPSSQGIMQPRWGREQVRQLLTGTLLFTPEQARVVRAEARSRMRLRTGTLEEERT